MCATALLQLRILVIIITDQADFIKLRPQILNKDPVDSHLHTLTSDTQFPSFAMWTGNNIWYISWNSGSFSKVSRPLRIRELTAWNGDNLEEGVPKPHPRILIHQVAVNSSVRSVTTRIT
jgi:hypothetical protein